MGFRWTGHACGIGIDHLTRLCVASQVRCCYYRFELDDCTPMPLSGLQCNIIFWIVMLYLCLDCYIISMSGLQCYTYVWFANLYLCPELKCYIYVWFANLYLFLLYSFLPTSVMVTSAFSKFDFRPVIPTSGLHLYTYVCYIQIRFGQF